MSVGHGPVAVVAPLLSVGGPWEVLRMTRRIIWLLLFLGESLVLAFSGWCVEWTKSLRFFSTKQTQAHTPWFDGQKAA